MGKKKDIVEQINDLARRTNIMTSRQLYDFILKLLTLVKDQTQFIKIPERSNWQCEPQESDRDELLSWFNHGVRSNKIRMYESFPWVDICPFKSEKTYTHDIYRSSGWAEHPFVVNGNSIENVDDKGHRFETPGAQLALEENLKYLILNITDRNLLSEVKRDAVIYAKKVSDANYYDFNPTGLQEGAIQTFHNILLTSACYFYNSIFRRSVFKFTLRKKYADLVFCKTIPDLELNIRIKPGWDTLVKSKSKREGKFSSSKDENRSWAALIVGELKAPEHGSGMGALNFWGAPVGLDNIKNFDKEAQKSVDPRLESKLKTALNYNIFHHLLATHQVVTGAINCECDYVQVSDGSVTLLMRIAADQNIKNWDRDGLGLKRITSAKNFDPEDLNKYPQIQIEDLIVITNESGELPLLNLCMIANSLSESTQILADRDKSYLKRRVDWSKRSVKSRDKYLRKMKGLLGAPFDNPIDRREYRNDLRDTLLNAPDNREKKFK